MTEAEWLAGDDPRLMLAFVWRNSTDRQMRLVGTACARRVWQLLGDRYALRALQRVEEFVDGLCKFQAMDQSMRKGGWHGPPSFIAQCVANAIHGVGRYHTGEALYLAINDVMSNARCVSDGHEPGVQAAIVRDVYRSSWRSAQLEGVPTGELITLLAQAAYDERVTPTGVIDPARLAVLADALEEAGCVDDTLLSHLRSPGPHVRGCWALDLVLGRS